MPDSIEQQETSNSNAMDFKTLEQIAEQESQEQASQEQEQREQVPQIPTSELLYPAISLITAVAAPNWGIAEEENKAIADSYAEVLDKYYPNVGESFSVELNALLITAAIFMPRIGKPRQLPPPKEEKGADVVPIDTKEPGNSGGGGLDSMGEETLNGETVH